MKNPVWPRLVCPTWCPEWMGRKHTHTLLHSKPYRINSCRDAKTEENMIDLVVSYIKLIRFGCLRSVSGVWNRVLYNIQYLVVQLVTSKPSYVATRVRISAQSHELRFSLMLCPTSHNLKSGERIISWVHKIQLHGRRGKGTAESSRDKNEGKHGRRKVEKSYVTFLLCDPGWCVHKSDVQNICDDNTTHTWYIINMTLCCCWFTQSVYEYCPCVCVLLSHLFWRFQPGSHRRKATQEFFWGGWRDVRENPSSCYCAEIRTHLPTSESFEVTNWTTGDATEETTVTQQVSHWPVKCQARLWSQRGTKVNGPHHGDNPLLRRTGIQIATNILARSNHRTS